MSTHINARYVNDGNVVKCMEQFSTQRTTLQSSTVYAGQFACSAVFSQSETTTKDDKCHMCDSLVEDVVLLALDKEHNVIQI